MPAPEHDEATVKEIRDWQDWLDEYEPIFKAFEERGVSRDAVSIVLCLNVVVGQLTELIETTSAPLPREDEDWLRDHREEYEGGNDA